MSKGKVVNHSIEVEKKKIIKFSMVKNWIWTYFDDTIKIFVPYELKSSFQKFLKQNKGIKVRECAEYRLSKSAVQIKNNPQYYRLRSGRDYITKNQHRDVLTNWLKLAIKEL